MSRRRLVWQLLIPYCAIGVVVMLSLGLYGAYSARRLYLDHTAVILQRDVRVFQRRIADLPGDRLQAICRETAELMEVRITVIAPDGKVLADSEEQPDQMDNHRDRPEVAAAMRGQPGRSTRYSNTLNEDLIYLALPADGRGKSPVVVRAAVPVQRMMETLRTVYGHIAVATGLMIGLLAAVSVWCVRRSLRPLGEIHAGALRLAHGDLHHPIPSADTEEFARLAESLNHMAEQLDGRIRTILCQQNEHEAMLASMEEGVLAVDNSGRILSLNEACATILGGRAANLRGRMVCEAIRKPDLLRFINTALSSEVSVDADLQFFGGQDRWLNAHGTGLHDAEGRRTGALIVLHDVTRLRQLENIRRDFVANVSHELKTPITSIKGFVETLLDEKFENRDNALRFLNIVLRQVNRLDAIIMDLLSLSRIERGAEEQSVPLELGALCDVLRAACEMCEKKANDKQIDVIIHCPEGLRANINAPLLEQAVVNLVDNAVKYSEPGATVHVEAESVSDGIVIRVRDEGCGIPSQHLPRLFERFYRVDKARSRELGGTGLGLAIVKHIAAALRGSVEVQSNVGKGSVFTIRLPSPLP